MSTQLPQQRLRYLLISFLMMSCLCVMAQAPSSADTIVQAFENYRQNTFQEKLFVHTDQNDYLTGETLWFKIYYVDGTFHKPANLSKVAYIELVDKDGKSVLQTKVALTTGGGNGTLFLPASLRSGTYRMRAYTNWMKNFGAAYFFEKNLTLVNPFTPLDLPIATAAADYDIQFFPEGGNLVQGLASKVAFKVADSIGHGITVRGWLINAKNDTLDRFTSFKFGMGTFMVTPAANETYRVLLRDEQDRIFTRSLPAVLPQGYVIQVNETGTDSLKVTAVTNLSGASVVYLFVHTRNAIKLAQVRSIQHRPIQGGPTLGETTFVIDRKTLGEGISHLTLFDAGRVPVCERLYFKRPTPLTITLKPDQPTYVSRSKVTVDVSVLAASTKTNQATMSMAVYRLDSLAATGSGNILSSLWLRSDLPGVIESPDYYVQTNTPEVAKATDNLMLTHGWRRFRWADVLRGQTGQPRPFIAEVNGPIVQGTLTDLATGTPLPNKRTYLSIIGKPIRLYVSRSDSAGRIQFEMQDFYGPRTLIAQTNPEDSLAKLTITNPFVETTDAQKLSDVLIPESRADELLSRSVAMQVQSAFWGERAMRYRYPSVDSAAFYSRPRNTYLLDAYTRFPRMEEVLREYVPGVMPRKRQGHFRLDVLNEPYRAIFENAPLVLIDGVPVFDMDKVIEFSPLKIKQLDVVTNSFAISPAVFSGIISFMTYKGDLGGFPLNTRLQKLEYDGLQLQREFYAPQYDQTKTTRQKNGRLPDARTLLYWNPDLTTTSQDKTRAEFYTSDQPGTYLVEVNGMTTDGSAGSQQVRFEVQNTPK